MDNSIFLAKFWGWYLIIFFFILSFNPKRIKQIFNDLKESEISDELLAVVFYSHYSGIIEYTVSQHLGIKLEVGHNTYWLDFSFYWLGTFYTSQTNNRLVRTFQY